MEMMALIADRHTGRRIRALLACALLAAVAPAAAQVNEPEHEGYLLVGQFGEICTMCEAMVVCGEGDEALRLESLPAAGSYTLYYLHTRTFWSQVTTIWEWFIANFNSKLVPRHTRPVSIHTLRDGRWSGPAAGEVAVSLDPPELRFSDGQTIDRAGFRWLDAGSEAHGSCQRLPLWDTLERIPDTTRTAGVAP